MCVLVLSPGKKITDEQFENCWQNNPDGFGMAWRDGDNMRYQKGLMELVDAKKAYDDLMKTHKEQHILHWRVGTSGGKSPEMTHPFIVSPESKLSLSYSGKAWLLFHNGIVASWKEMYLQYCIAIGKMPEGDVSDTRAMAMLVSRLGDKFIAELTGKWILMTKPMALYWGNFQKVDDVLFSNNSYEAEKKSKALVVVNKHSSYGYDSRTNSSKTKPSGNTALDMPWDDPSLFNY